MCLGFGGGDKLSETTNIGLSREDIKGGHLGYQILLSENYLLLNIRANA